MITRKNIQSLFFGAVITVITTNSLLAKDSYYTEAPQFHMWSDAKAARWEISRIGPIGIGLEPIQPAFTMRILNVEEGSPAAATAKLKKGLIIESINGQVLKDRDPRVILSATGFMNFAGGKKANRKSLWFEEMKLPEVEK